MKYNKQLDGLRFIAISMVLFSHFYAPLAAKLSAGFFGVDLFFVISGFLITSILLKSEDAFGQAYKNFIGRRTLRIFPIYYLSIGILYCIGNENVNANIVSLVSYTYNYAISIKRVPSEELGHLWSLCVEEQFYLVWPFAVLALRNNNTSLKILIFAVFIAGTLQVLFGIFDVITPHNYNCTFPRAMSLVTGALGSVVHKEKKVSVFIMTNRWIEFAVFFGLVLLIFVESPINYICFPILSLFLVLKTANSGFTFSPFNKLLLNRFAVFVGTISYGVYLYHSFVKHYFGDKFFEPFIWNKIDFNSLGVFEKLQYNEIAVTSPLYSVVTIAVAYLSFRYIEKPILSLKDKLFPYKKTVSSKREVISVKIAMKAEKV